MNYYKFFIQAIVAVFVLSISFNGWTQVFPTQRDPTPRSTTNTPPLTQVGQTTTGTVHEFTLKNGNTLQAIALDITEKNVFLRNFQNGLEGAIPRANFSEEDQTYFNEFYRWRHGGDHPLGWKRGIIYLPGLDSWVFPPGIRGATRELGDGYFLIEAPVGAWLNFKVRDDINFLIKWNGEPRIYTEFKDNYLYFSNTPNRKGEPVGFHIAEKRTSPSRPRAAGVLGPGNRNPLINTPQKNIAPRRDPAPKAKTKTPPILKPGLAYCLKSSSAFKNLNMSISNAQSVYILDQGHDFQLDSLNLDPGKVGAIAYTGREETTLKGLEKLTNLECFSMKQELHRTIGWTTDTLSKLPRLTQLEVFYRDDQPLKVLSRMKQLKHLSLHCRDRDSSADFLAGLPQLQSLYLHLPGHFRDDSHSNQEISMRRNSISAMKNLTILNYIDLAEIPGNMDMLMPLKKLRVLSLPSLNRSELEQLAEANCFDYLTWLAARRDIRGSKSVPHVSGSRYDKEPLSLEHFPRLECVDTARFQHFDFHKSAIIWQMQILGTKVEHFEVLQSMPQTRNLERLVLEFPQKDLTRLGEMNRLRSLVVNRFALGSDRYPGSREAYLSGLTNLVDLRLEDVTDTAVIHGIETCSRLRVLEIASGSNLVEIVPSGLKSGKTSHQQPLHHLRIKYLGNLNTIQQLRPCTNQLKTFEVGSLDKLFTAPADFIKAKGSEVDKVGGCPLLQAKTY